MTKPQDHHHITISKGVRYAETERMVTDEELAEYNRQHTKRRRAAERIQEERELLDDWLG